MRHSSWMLACALVVAGCSNEIEGPAPTVGDGTDAAPTTPTYACNEQLETWVSLKGTDFSPLVIDSLAKDEPTNIDLPDVQLALAGTPEGGALDGDPFSIVLQDEGERIDVRWIDNTQLDFRVTEDLAFPPGVYDITVTNANGETTTQQAAFGVVPRPVVTGLVPAYMCLAEGARQLEVQGDWFVVDSSEGNPTVNVGGNDYAPSATGDCRDLAAVFGGAQACRSLTIEIPGDEFDPGLEEVVVTNPAPAACASDVDADGSELRIVPPPTLTQIAEELTCLAQGEREFVATGTDFINTGDATPTVLIADKVYATTLENCETVDVYNGSFERCTDARFTIPSDDIMPGVHPVVIENPAPAGCSSSEPVDLTVSAPPSVASVVPEVLCSEQLENTLVITGTDFLVVDGTTPEVLVGGETFTSVASVCEDVPSVLRSAVERCTQLTVTVPAGTLTPGEQAITVTNPAPAGCDSVDAVTVAFVPPPSVTGLVEPYTCIETRSDQLTVEGTGFLVVDGTNPTVAVGTSDATVISVDGCSAIAGTTTAQTCTSILIELAQNGVPVGANDVVVTNPAPAACFSEEMVPLEVFPAPTLSAVNPGFFCADTADTGISITGSNIYVDNGTYPTVQIGGSVFPATAATGCTDTSIMGLQVCTEISATVTAGILTTGSTEVAITNPEPVACDSTMNADILVAGPPVITSANPTAVCAGTTFDGDVSLLGEVFLRIDNNVPTVSIESVANPGSPVTVTPILSNCTAVPHDTLTIENCTELAINIPVAIRGENVNISVTNPAPSDCGGSSTYLLEYAPTPRIDAVTPLRLCDDGGEIQIDGANFDQGMVVTLGATAATMVSVNMDGTQAIATFDMGIAPDQLYDLILTNPNTCTTTHDEQIRVVTGPRSFYVDPPILYDGISTQVTIYLTGLYGGAVTGGEVIDEAGTITALTNLTFDPNNPNTIQAVVPAGLAAGAFDVRLYDDLMCSETSPDLFTTTNNLTVAVEEVVPPFGWTDVDNAVTITASNAPAQGEVQFAATPRVYLNPTVPQMGDVATEVRAVEFLSTTELTGIVPSQLPPASYDLIVINPDGSVGFLSQAYDSTLNPPPIVDAVSPGSWETNNSAFPFAIEGADFRMPTIEVTCTDTGGTVTTVTPTVNTTTSTATKIEATVDTNGLSGLSVCELRVTNTDEGTYVDFAPITITNPAGNFVSFAAGANLVTARRDHAMVSGAPSRTARYIYALGGLDTADAQLDSIEISPLDRLGRPGTWSAIRSVLPAALNGTDATRIGDFIYIAGGDLGTGLSNQIYRARVLDPLDAPDINNVEFDIDPNMMGGPTPGVYYYRVSAVMAAGDSQNPGGETLASERQPVRVPFQGVTLTLSWTPIANAAEYRVYRSPMADLNAGSEELIATIPAASTSFVDNGTATTTMETPLPLGELGTWHSAGTLTTPRTAHGLAGAEDPVTPGTWYLYVIGGHDGTGTDLASTEYLTITVDGATGNQTAGALAATTANLGSARSELEAVVGDTQNATNLSTVGTTIYALGGQSGNQITRDIDYAVVAAGGDIAAWTPTQVALRSRAGYASAIANNTIVMACGQNGAPSASSDKQEILDPGPALDSGSSLGNVGVGDRYLLGSASFSGYLYISGGETGAATATDTTVYSILGGTP